MKLVTVAVLTVLLSATLGCDNKEEREKARADLKLTEVKMFRDLQDQLHRSNVDLARTLMGEHSAFVLDQCYSDGYDSVQNDDHTFHNADKLGPKYVATCDKIANAVKEYSDAARKQHEREISH